MVDDKNQMNYNEKQQNKLYRGNDHDKKYDGLWPVRDSKRRKEIYSRDEGCKPPLPGCQYPYAEKVIPKKVKSEPIQKTVDDSKYSKLNEFEKQIIDILKKSDMQIDELSRELKRNVSEINTKLIMLEVKGLVKKLPGSKYQLKL